MFFFFLFLFFFAGRLNSRCSSSGLWRFSCLFGGFGRFLFKIWSSPLVPDLHFSGGLFMTRAPRRRSLASSAPAAGISGHGGKRFPARGRHAPACLVLFGACVGHVPPFLAVHGVGWGLRWSLLCWVVPGTARGGHAPPSPAVFRHCSLCRQLLWAFLFMCTFPCVYCGSQFVYL